MSLKVANKKSIWKVFSSYRNQQKFLDCQFKCGSEYILCHKLVLYCFSPKFKHLLANFQHSEDDVVTFMLPEVDVNDLKSFLDTLYAKIGREDEDNDSYDLSLDLARMFGFIDFDPVDTIDIHHAYPEVKVEIKHEIDVDDDEDQAFGEDLFQNFADYEFDRMKPKSRKRRFGYGQQDDYARPKSIKLAIRAQEQDLDYHGHVFNSDDDDENYHESRLKKKRAFKLEQELPYGLEEDVDVKRKKVAVKDKNKPKKEAQIWHCKLCNIDTRGQRKYQRHRKEVHYPEMKVQLSCKHCRKEMSLYNFRFHCNYHEVIICDECGKTFANNIQLNLHIKKAHSIFKCEKCCQEFKGFTALESHNADEHFKDSYSCEICGKMFGSHKRIVSHKYKVHRSKDSMNFKCDYCEKMFPTYIKRLNHTHSVHLKDYPFKCRHNCGAKYNDCDNLARHEKQKHGKAYPLYHGFEHLRPAKTKKK